MSSNKMKKKNAKNIIKRGGGWGEEVADGAATFGRIMAFLGMLGSVLIGGAMIGIGIWLIRKKNRYTAEANAKVIAATCDTVYNKDTNGKNTSANVQCNATVKYMVNGKDYTGGVVTSDNRVYQEHQDMTVMVDPSNPHEFQQASPVSNKTLGIILIVIGAIIMIGSIIWFMLTIYYREAAIAETAFTAIDAMKA